MTLNNREYHLLESIHFVFENLEKPLEQGDYKFVLFGGCEFSSDLFIYMYHIHKKRKSHEDTFGFEAWLDAWYKSREIFQNIAWLNEIKSASFERFYGKWINVMFFAYTKVTGHENSNDQIPSLIESCKSCKKLASAMLEHATVK